jgi:hypothetical protein
MGRQHLKGFAHALLRLLHAVAKFFDLLVTLVNRQLCCRKRMRLLLNGLVPGRDRLLQLTNSLVSSHNGLLQLLDRLVATHDGLLQLIARLVAFASVMKRLSLTQLLLKTGALGA